MQAQQTAAQYDNASAAGLASHQCLGIGHVTEAIDTGQFDTGDVGHMGSGPGCQDERGIRLAGAMFIHNHSIDRIDLYYPVVMSLDNVWMPFEVQWGLDIREAIES